MFFFLVSCRNAFLSFPPSFPRGSLLRLFLFFISLIRSILWSSFLDFAPFLSSSLHRLPSITSDLIQSSSPQSSNLFEPNRSYLWRLIPTHKPVVFGFSDGLEIQSWSLFDWYRCRHMGHLR